MLGSVIAGRQVSPRRSIAGNTIEERPAGNCPSGSSRRVPQLSSASRKVRKRDSNTIANVVSPFHRMANVMHRFDRSKFDEKLSEIGPPPTTVMDNGMASRNSLLLFLLCVYHHTRVYCGYMCAHVQMLLGRHRSSLHWQLHLVS